MAITVTHDNLSIECTKAVKCTNKCYIHCFDAENNIIAAFSKIEDFEAFTISGGDWSEPDESAIAEFSYARGRNAIASGYGSTAIGSSVTSSSYHSTALGSSSEATASYSRAEGQYCSATDEHAQAIGIDCTASGAHSFACGKEVTASEDHLFAIGCYNEDLSDSAFEIGRGERNDLLNVFRVTKPGKVEARGDVVANAKDKTPISLQNVNEKLNNYTTNIRALEIGAGNTQIISNVSSAYLIHIKSRALVTLQIGAVVNVYSVYNNGSTFSVAPVAVNQSSNHATLHVNSNNQLFVTNNNNSSAARATIYYL